MRDRSPAARRDRAVRRTQGSATAPNTFRKRELSEVTIKWPSFMKTLRQGFVSILFPRLINPAPILALGYGARRCQDPGKMAR